MVSPHSSIHIILSPQHKSSPAGHDITTSVCLGTEAREELIAMVKPGLKNSQRTNAWPSKIPGMCYNLQRGWGNHQ
jgi:hypothetical protein